MMKSPLGYRPEIDGLRTVAVVPVVLFHAGFSVFAGGFVGVDVFFVISGYLITTIILRECAQGEFSILRFYERRARRILPALFLVMACSLPVAWWLLFPTHFVDYGESLAATSVFSSNILFWKERGYFGTVAELKPLLHTWSLAVEEQFYIIFPLGVVVLWRFGFRAVAITISVVAVGSFVFSDFMSTRRIAANFFLLPSRAWELLAGSLVAIWLIRWPAPSGRSAGFGALLGLCMIAAGIFLLDEHVPFPGRATLLPVVGTVLVILCAGPDNLAGRILSLGPMVGVGLISYSVYLWHQPVFVMVRHGSLTEPGLLEMSGLALLSFGLAYLSWKYVEAPFRDRNKVSRRAIFTGSLAGIVVFCAVGLSIARGGGFYWRFDEQVQALLAIEEEDGRGRNGCVEAEGLPPEGCVFNPDLPYRAFMWGDSHAMALAENLAAQLAKHDIALETATTSGCAAILNYGQTARDCPLSQREALTYLNSPESPEVVILHSRWSIPFNPESIDNGEEGFTPRTSGIEVFRATGDVKGMTQTEWVTEDFRETIRRLLALEKTIVVVGNVPHPGWHVVRYLARGILTGRPLTTDLSVSAAHVSEKNQAFLAAIEPFLNDDRLRFVDPYGVFCNTYLKDRCVAELDDRPVYRDDNHLSTYGSGLLAPVVAESVSEVMPYE